MIIRNSALCKLLGLKRNEIILSNVCFVFIDCPQEAALLTAFIKRSGSSSKLTLRADVFLRLNRRNSSA